MRLMISAALLATGLGLAPAWADGAPDLSDWAAIEKAARGQTVYFNAWGGSQNINAYIEWAGGQLKERYGVTVTHVKLEDTATAVSTVLAEKAAGKAEGSVDLIWINGENFAAMKDNGLMLTPGWAESLPNWAYVDIENKPTIRTDFTVPVEGLESPWGMAKLVFFHDTARLGADAVPTSAKDLLAWAQANPGRFSYPAPPDFIGSSFLKQLLHETLADPKVLLKPVVDAEFETVTKPLFDYLDQLHPVLWRKGQAYPQNYPAMKQLLADNEVDIIFAFNPSEASNAIANGELPDTVRSFTFPGGTLSNTHFVAIPFNASAKEGALLLANFLISPEAQLRKQDPAVWGDPTVLSMDKIPAETRDAFNALDLGVATLAPADLGPALDEPHPTWMVRVEQEWAKRYGVGN